MSPVYHSKLNFLEKAQTIKQNEMLSMEFNHTKHPKHSMHLCTVQKKLIEQKHHGCKAGPHAYFFLASL